jgi:hypothetical protein
MNTPGPRDEPARSFRRGDEGLARYPLLEAMIERRSRRFGDRMSLSGARWPTTAAVPRSR